MIAAIVLADTVDPNGVTPGVWGFVATALIGIAAIFLLLDMNRRLRRLRYRDEAKANIDAEQAVEKLIDEVNRSTDKK